MNGYISAADVAHIYKITKNQVYVLACVKHWRRIRTGQGTVRYHIADVADTLAHRDATNTQRIH